MSLSREVEIKNKYGFHVRPSTSFAKLATEFSSTITVALNSNAVDGKSIMMLMTLGATQGQKILVTAEGDDEEVALEKLVEHVESQFGGIE